MQKTTIKIKAMTIGEMLLAIDRLTRFKLPEERINRVFREMIAKYQIEPKISFKDYENLSAEAICTAVEHIFQVSIAQLHANIQHKPMLYKIIASTNEETFILSEHTKKLLSAKIPYETILELNKENHLSQNLNYLRYLIETNLPAKNIRQQFKTKFPIEKVVLVEGITEEILLPKFARILKKDFDASGIELIPAGGKNQVAKEYLKLRDALKIPIVILLDADAKPIAETISAKLRELDKLILIKKGEFEDILPTKLIEKAINYKFINIFSLNESDLSTETSRVKDLEEIYRVNGLGEFKKAEFAHNVEAVLNEKSPISDEIAQIINEIYTI